MVWVCWPGPGSPSRFFYPIDPHPNSFDYLLVQWPGLQRPLEIVLDMSKKPSVTPFQFVISPLPRALSLPTLVLVMIAVGRSWLACHCIGKVGNPTLSPKYFF